MTAMQEVKHLVRAGELSKAYSALQSATTNRQDHTEAEVLRAELLERLGQCEQARTLAEKLSRSSGLTPGQLSACNVVLGLVDSASGDFDSAVTRMQRAIGIAQTAGDYEKASWAQMRLLLIVSDHVGPEAVVSLLAELRNNVARTADPVLTAALHLFVAQMEAKRSLLSSSRRHVRLALSLLHTSPNVWLEGMASHIDCAIAVMRSDFTSALHHSWRSVELADQSGVATLRAAGHGNLANVLYLTGEYERSVEQLELALPECSHRVDSHIGAIDTLARISLVQNQLDRCDDLLDQIDRIRGPRQGRGRYAYRHALLIRANALARRGLPDEALAQLETAIALADASVDSLLLHLAVLTKAEVLVSTDRLSEALEAVQSVAATVACQPPDVHALYERVLACALLRGSHPEAALFHFERAARIYSSCHHAP